MCTCSCTLPLTFAKSLASGSLITYQIQRNSYSRFRDTERRASAHVRTFARSHVQMYPTQDLCNMHRGWSLNIHQILSLSAYPFPSYSLAANFYSPSLCTCHMPQWLPRWTGVGSIHGRRDAATHQRRPFVNQTRGCRDISPSKASRGRVVSCCVGPLILSFVRYLRRNFTPCFALRSPSSQISMKSLSKINDHKFRNFGLIQKLAYM